MQKLFSNSLALAIVSAACVGGFATLALAQTSAPQNAPAAPAQPDTQVDGTKSATAEKPSAPDPLAEILKASDRETTRGRAELRDSLYALLATAADETAAKRVAAEIQKLWLTTGSPTVSLLIRRADRAVKAKNTELALQFLDAALELAPDYAEAWNRRAFIYYQAGDVRRAVGDLRRALALDPNHFKALEGLGNIMRSSGDEQAAFKAYERLIEVNRFADGALKIYEDLRERVRGRGI